MNIKIKRVDVLDALKYNTSITLELLYNDNLWEIQVPNIIESDEAVYGLSSADDLVDKYTELLNETFKCYNYKNAWKSVKNRFICSSSTQINKAAILPSTVDISNEFLKYGFERKAWAGDRYRYCGFGTVVDGKLLSWCIENSHYLDDGSTEIGVKTNVNDRKNGYAASNVAALCDCLQKNGVSTIYYECDLENIASFNTAKRVNLEYTGKVFYFGFQK